MKRGTTSCTSYEKACAAMHQKFELTKGGACTRAVNYTKHICSPFFAAPAAFAWRLFHNELIAHIYKTQQRLPGINIIRSQKRLYEI